MLTPITSERARELFFSSDARYVSQEQAAVYYDRFSGRAPLECYLSHGCLVIKNEDDIHIHALWEESDVLAAAEDARGLSGTSVMVLTLGQTPAELSDKRGTYKFARGYAPYTDGAVRPLTKADREAAQLCCADDAEDTPIGRRIAGEFLSYFDDFVTDPTVINLGLFEGDSLTGFVQGFCDKVLGITTVNIFTKRSCRGRGYAKRLLLSLTACDTDTVFCYSCVRYNTSSAATAKACGFDFKGEYLFL